jgi:hypothetical protein
MGILYPNLGRRDRHNSLLRARALLPLAAKTPGNARLWRSLRLRS